MNTDICLLDVAEDVAGALNHSGLVALEDVAGVDLGGDIVEDGVVAVGDDGLREGLELGEVIDNEAAKECSAVGEGGLIDDYLGTLGLDAFHDALNAALTEVVGVGLHGEAIDANDAFLLGGGVEVATIVVVVVAGFLQDLVGDEVLAGAIALYDGGHHVLRHGSIVGQKLLGVLGQTVSAITE